MRMDADDYRLPIYANARNVKASIGVGYKLLMRLVSIGAVRSFKEGNMKQSARLFRSQDILDAMERLSIGKAPLKRNRLK
jgi:hypothetical protein